MARVLFNPGQAPDGRHDGSYAKEARVWAKVKDHWYVEPEDCTVALLRVERFRGQIWDPACGGGNIVRACHAAGRSVIGTDLVDRKWDDDRGLFWGVHDFLAEGPKPFNPADNIVSNPPFDRGRLAEAFIRKALAQDGLAKAAFYLDVRFLGGDARAAGLWAEHPPARIWWLTPRPSCPPGDYLAAGHKAEGGTADYCWVVYDLTAPQAPTVFRQLRRQPSPRLRPDKAGGVQP